MTTPSPARPALAALAVLLLSLPAAAYEQRQGNAVARIQEVHRENGQEVLRDPKVEDGRPTLSLAFETVLTLTFEGQAPLSFPGKKDEELLDEVVHRINIAGAWRDLSRPRLVKEALPNDRQRWQLTFRMDPQKPSKGKDYELLLKPVSFRDGAGKEHAANWDTISFRVTTSVENPDRPDPNQLRDGSDVEQVAERSARRLWVWVLAGVGAVLFGVSLGLVVWQLVRRRLGRAAALSPDQWALRELERVEAQALPDAGKAERYHTLISDVVRRYLELRFRLRAPQQTTTEFLSTMRSWPLLPAPEQALLREFLERCDLAKFARAEPSPDECRRAGAMARAFVEQTHAAAPAPDARPAGETRRAAGFTPAGGPSPTRRE